MKFDTHNYEALAFVTIGALKQYYGVDPSP